MLQRFVATSWSWMDWDSSCSHPQVPSLVFPFRPALYKRDTMIVTATRDFADWTCVPDDERLTEALLDRLTHRAHSLEFAGESYRFRQRMQRETEKESAG